MKGNFMRKKTKTKMYTIYKMEDERDPKGFIYNIAGPLISEAIDNGKISKDDTWDYDDVKLINDLKMKGIK